MEVYLNAHLAKYPLMQIEDILKLYLQGILGPAHAVEDFEKISQRINNEYQLIKDENYPYKLIEEISSEYVRVYLKPYYESRRDFALLIKAFILSSKEKGDTSSFKNEVKNLINEKNKDYINGYLAKDNYLISHSEIYRNNYHPHYLVINRKYLSKI